MGVAEASADEAWQDAADIEACALRLGDACALATASRRQAVLVAAEDPAFDSHGTSASSYGGFADPTPRTARPARGARHRPS